MIQPIDIFKNLLYINTVLKDSTMAYLSYRGSILDEIRDEIRLDSYYRKKGLDNYDEESYDDFANDFDYDYTFDYAD